MSTLFQKRTPHFVDDASTATKTIHKKNSFRTVAAVAMSTVLCMGIMSTAMVAPAFATAPAAGDRVGMNAGMYDAEYGYALINTNFANSVYGGYSYGNDAEHNVVTVNPSVTVGGNVYGGYSEGRLDSDAEDNTVNIYGTVNGQVYGGFSNVGDSDDNIVNLHDATVGGNVYGGHASGIPYADYFTDNTLNVYSSSRISNAYNFQNYSFHIPTLATGSTMLAIADPNGLNLTTPYGFIFPSVAIRSVARNSTLIVGDKITLIDNTNLTSTGIQVAPKQSAMDGIATLWMFDVNVNPNGAVVATYTGKQANPAAKTIGVGTQVGNLAVLGGGTFVSTQGINSILKAESTLIAQRNTLIAEAGQASDNSNATTTDAAPIVSNTQEEINFIPFATASYGQSNYDNNLDIDLNGFNFMGGIGFSVPSTAGRWIFAPFIEVGMGEYDSNGYNVRNDGDYDFFGGGAVIRYDSKRKYYFEITARAGQTNGNYDSHVFASPVQYDSSSLYAAGSIGGGYIMNLSQKMDLDMNVNYTYTWTDGDSFVILGDSLKVNSSSSNAVTIGAKLDYEINEMLIPYIGADFEFVIDGAQDNTINGNKVAGADNEGFTTYLTIGSEIAFTPNMHLDVAVDGFMGVRNGVMGTATFRIAF